MTLQTDTHPSRSPVRTYDMVDRRLGMRTSPFRMQIPIILGTGASFFLQLLLPPWLMRGRASKPQPQRRPTRRDLLHGPGAQGALSQRPRAHHAPHGLYTALQAPTHGNDRHQPRLYGYDSSKRVFGYAKASMNQLVKSSTRKSH